MELNKILPQGPKLHCGNESLHTPHPNSSGQPPSSTPEGDSPSVWCDGVPPLKPFVELTVRVPLDNHFISAEDLADLGHGGALDWIMEEGLSTFIWDEVDSPNTRAVLRLRACGHDRVYPLKNGTPDPQQGSLW